MTYDREKTFKLLQQRNWKALLELFKNNKTYDQIQQDDITKSVLESQFIRELIDGSTFNHDPDFLFLLEQFHMLHTGSNFHFTLPSEDVNRLVERIIIGYRSTQAQNALRYSKNYPNLPISIELLQEFELTQPKVIDHSQNRTISLFKSKQEYEFYRAVRDVYSTYLVFPNVAISALVDFEQIKHFLDQNERNYFFKALVDCVVFDAENAFKPFKMLEIDSEYHDSAEQQTKDRMKDKIIAKAGQKLLRVRVKAKMSDLDISRLIREILREQSKS